jgi:DNA modification methylase
MSISPRVKPRIENPDMDEQGQFNQESQIPPRPIVGQVAGQLQTPPSMPGMRPILDWQGNFVQYDTPTSRLDIDGRGAPDFSSGTRISKFREAYPQYNSLSDDDLLGAIHRRHYPQMARDEFESAFLRKYGTPEPGMFGTMWRGLAGSVIGMGQSVYGGAQALTGFEEGVVGEWFGRTMDKYAPPPSIQKSILDDWTVLGNYRWWSYNIPSLIPYILVSVASGGAGAALGGRVGAGVLKYAPNTVGLANAKIAGGTLGVASTHSVLEGGRTYVQAVEEGQSHEEASKLAASVAGQNMLWLTVTGAPQMRAVLTRIGAVPTRSALNKVSTDLANNVKTQMSQRVPGQIAQQEGLAMIMGFEAVQEMGQEFISNMAFNRPWYEHLPDAGLLGGIGGAMFSRGMRMFDKRVDIGRYDGMAQEAADLMKQVQQPPTPPASPEIGGLPAPRPSGPMTPPGGTSIAEQFTGTPEGQALMGQLGQRAQALEGMPMDYQGALHFLGQQVQQGNMTQQEVDTIIEMVPGERESIPMFDRLAQSDEGRALQRQMGMREEVVNNIPISSVEDAMTYLSQQIIEGNITQEEANQLFDFHPGIRQMVDEGHTSDSAKTLAYYRARVDEDAVRQDIDELEQTLTKDWTDMTILEQFKLAQETEGLTEAGYRNMLALALSDSFAISRLVDEHMTRANRIKEQIIESQKPSDEISTEFVNVIREFPQTRTRILNELQERGHSRADLEAMAPEQLSELAKSESIPFVQQITEDVSEARSTKEKEISALDELATARGAAKALITDYGSQPLTRTRKLGSLENVPAEKLDDTIRILLDAGMDSRVIPHGDNFELMFWRRGTLNKAIKDGIILRTKELAGEGITANQVRKLGRLYGYSDNDINAFIQEWQARVQEAQQAEQAQAEPQPEMPVEPTIRSLGEMGYVDPSTAKSEEEFLNIVEKNVEIKLQNADVGETQINVENLPDNLRTEIEREVENVQLAIQGAQETGMFEGVRLSTLESDLSLLQQNPTKYFAKQILYHNEMESALRKADNRGDAETHAKLSETYQNIFDELTSIQESETIAPTVDKYIEPSEFFSAKNKGETFNVGDIITHPATFPKKFIPVFADLVKSKGANIVLDPFGGVGTIGDIKTHGYQGQVWVNELEGEWVSQHSRHDVDRSMTGDARKMPIKTGEVDMIVTSPTYGNLLGKSRLQSQELHTLSYANALGRSLSEGNTGSTLFTDKYRSIHREAYKEFFRVLKDDGTAVINVKDPISKGQRVPVTDFHIQAMEEAGFKLVDTIEIKAKGLPEGGLKTPKVDTESILVFEKQSVAEPKVESATQEAPIFIRTEQVGNLEASPHAGELMKLINQTDRQPLLEAFRLGHIKRVDEFYDGTDYSFIDGEAGLREAFNALSQQDQKTILDVVVRNQDSPEGQTWQMSPEERTVLQKSNEAVYFAMSLAELNQNPTKFLTEYGGIELSRPLRALTEPKVSPKTSSVEGRAVEKAPKAPKTTPVRGSIRKLVPSQNQPEVPSPGQYWYARPTTHKKSGHNNIYIVDKIIEPGPDREVRVDVLDRQGRPTGETKIQIIKGATESKVLVRKIRDWKKRFIDLPSQDQRTETIPLSDFKSRFTHTEQLPVEAKARGKQAKRKQTATEQLNELMTLKVEAADKDVIPFTQEEIQTLRNNGEITTPLTQVVENLINDGSFVEISRNTATGEVTIALADIEGARAEVDNMFKQFQLDPETFADEAGLHGIVLEGLKKGAEEAKAREASDRIQKETDSIDKLIKQYKAGEINDAQFQQRYDELVKDKDKDYEDLAQYAHDSRDDAPMTERVRKLTNEDRQWVADTFSDALAQQDLDVNSMTDQEIIDFVNSFTGTDMWASLGLPINTEIIRAFTNYGKKIADAVGMKSKRLETLLYDKDLDKASLLKKKLKFYQMIAMPQVLARYAPDKFGPVHQGVMRGIRMRDSIYGKLIRDNKTWNEFVRADDATQHQVFKALIDGTLYEDITFGKGKVWTVQELRDRYNMSDRQIRYYNDIRSIMDTVSEMRINQAIMSGMTEMEAREAFGLRGYFTLSRGRGRWSVVFRDESSPRRKKFPGMTESKKGRAKKRPGEPRKMALEQDVYQEPVNLEGIPYGVQFFEKYSVAKMYFDQMKAEGKIPDGDIFQQKFFALKETKFLDRDFYKDLDPFTLMQLAEDKGIPMEAWNNDPYLKEIMTAVKSSNYNWARTIPRGDVPTAINMTENPEIVKAMNQHLAETVEEHVDRTARSYSRVFTKAELESALLGVKDDDAWSNYANKYIENAMGPDDFSNSTWANLRKITFTYNLALNASNAVLNLGQPFLTTLPFMLESGWGMKTGYALGKFLDGGTVATKYLFTSHKAIPERFSKAFPMLKAGLRLAQKEGIIAPSLTAQQVGGDVRDIVRIGGKKIHTAQIDNVVGSLQNITEKQNRIGSFAAMYMAAYDKGGLIDGAKGNIDMAKKLGELAGLSDEQLDFINRTVPAEKRAKVYSEMIGTDVIQNIYEGNITPQEKHRIAYKLGVHGSDTTQFIFGKHAIPKFIWGSGLASNPLRASFIFKGFLLNYVGFWANAFQGGRINYRQMLGLMGPLILMAGISGLPFAEDAKEALKAAGITDFDTALRRTMNNDRLADFVLKGVPASLPSNLAFDFSRRAGIGNILPRGTGRAAGSAFNMLGVGQRIGLSKDRPGAKRDLQAGTLTALSDFFGGAPLQMNFNVLEGVSDWHRGEWSAGWEKIAPNVIKNMMKAYRYNEEGALSYGGRIRADRERLSTVQLLQQSIGFKPLEIAKHEDLENAIRYITYNRRDVISNFNERIANAVRKGDEDKLEKILADIIRYNNRTPASERYDFRQQKESVRRRLILGTDEFADLRYAPRSMRLDVQQLQEQYKSR